MIFHLRNAALWAVLSTSAFARRSDYEIAADPDRLFANNVMGAMMVVFLVISMLVAAVQASSMKPKSLEVPISLDDGSLPQSSSARKQSPKKRPRFRRPFWDLTSCLSTLVCLPMLLLGVGTAVGGGMGFFVSLIGVGIAAIAIATLVATFFPSV